MNKRPMSRLVALALFLSASTALPLWAQPQFIHTIADSGPVGPSAVEIDDEGNTYLLGYFRGTVDFDPGEGVEERTPVGHSGMFLASYDPDGVFRFVKVFGGEGTDDARDMVIDAEGNVHITGRFYGTVDFDPDEGVAERTSNGSSDIFVVSFDRDGRFRQVFTIGADQGDMGTGIAVDASGNIFLTGNYFPLSDPIDFDPGDGVEERMRAGIGIFVAGYDADYNLRFVRTFDEPFAANSGSDIAVGPDGSFFVAGYFESTVDFDPERAGGELTPVGDYDTFLARFSPDGDLMFVNRIGGPGSDFPDRLRVDAAGNAYLIGRFEETAVFEGTSDYVEEHTSVGMTDIYLAGYSPSGALRFVTALGTPEYDLVNGLAVEATGVSYVTGQIADSLDFDPGDGVAVVEPSRAGSAFLVSYDASGGFRHVVSIEGGNSAGTAVAVHPDVGLRLTGSFQGTVDLDVDEGGRPFTSVGLRDIYLIALPPDGSFRVSNERSPVSVATPEITAWPNPADGVVTVSAAVPSGIEARIDVYDVLGRRVSQLHDGPLAAGTHTLTLDVSRFAPGLYFLRATTPLGTVAVGRLTVVR